METKNFYFIFYNIIENAEVSRGCFLGREENSMEKKRFIMMKNCVRFKSFQQFISNSFSSIAAMKNAMFSLVQLGSSLIVLSRSTH